MKRRGDDPEEFDSTTVRQRNGMSGLPAWMRALAWIGLPGFLVLYLLGAIPMLPSPILMNQTSLQATEKSVKEMEKTLDRHERMTGESIRLWRLVCRGVWKGSPDVQEECRR